MTLPAWRWDRTVAGIRSMASIVLWIELIFVATLPMAILTYLLPSEDINGESNGFMESLNKVPLELWIVSVIALALTPFLAITAMSERFSRFRRTSGGIVAIANMLLIVYAVLLVALPFVPIETKILGFSVLAIGCVVVVALLADTDKV
jgi:hypothetical protein